MNRLGLILFALLVVGFVDASRPAPSTASVLCRVRSKGLVVRDVCKSREETLTPAVQEELGLGGKSGPVGAPGPGSGDLRVLDAGSHEVGVVIGVNDYAGTAQVVGTVSLPTGSGPEFAVMDVDRNGLNNYGSCADKATLFRAPDCTGPAYQSCAQDSCGSVSGAFFARELLRAEDDTMCYVGEPSEVIRDGRFYRSGRSFGSSPAEVTFRCGQLGGIVTEPPTPCGGAFFYCAPCCIRSFGVSAMPMHFVDSSLVGAPPFRLVR